ncbi:hypothetical protein Patl1_03254 [Pistacia atlantica]|uniref:Uncharacterized protein n=1 Tax=Pistacia atlantica TaxID=434234 RepID=A0ACC1C4Y6_9ROSI|nr:hypothetical protein Patl1_03254 [Pistacia atlantica]
MLILSTYHLSWQSLPLSTSLISLNIILQRHHCILKSTRGRVLSN